MRQYNLLDTIVLEVDIALRTLFIPQKRVSQRPTPASNICEAQLSIIEKQHVAGLMRVNHAGEVCAQALYQGQNLTASSQEVKEKLMQAAIEEIDHLAWCEQRLHELESQPSIFNPLWYVGSLLLGSLAGIAGDGFSLGFLAETEYQVCEHLKKHLQKLPDIDKKSHAILDQMQQDENQHAAIAKKAGAIELPAFFKKLMYITSRILIYLSYRL